MSAAARIDRVRNELADESTEARELFAIQICAAFAGELQSKPNVGCFFPCRVAELFEAALDKATE